MKTERFLISQVMSPDAIELHLKSNQRDPLLMELVLRIADLTGRPEAQQTLFKALQEREQLHSTGIGEGIALPHARNALVGLVDRPAVVFGRHPSGIPYGALDEQPARLFFLLVAPTVSQHLQILARISRLLRVPRLRQQLLEVEQPARALQLIREAEERLA